MSFYRLAIAVSSAVLALLGAAIVIRTALAGGGELGYLIGALFTAAGLGRLLLLRRR